jgi:hypothetical protein
MATPKALNALQKTKEALDDIKSKLEPVIQRLKEDAFERATAQAQATVSLSIGMMKYMGSRLQGLDNGKQSDDPLRKELNQMRKVLAEIKARHTTEAKKSQPQAKRGEGNKGDQKQASTKTSISKQLLTKKKSNESGSPSTKKNETSDGQQVAANADNRNQRNNNKRRADNSKRRTKKSRST